MSKFTAGPWRAEGLDIMGEWEDGESITIANCGATRFCGDEAGGPKDKRMKAEDKANAALIAASPDLYEIMLEVYEASKLRRPIKKKTFEAVCEVLRKVDGAWR